MIKYAIRKLLPKKFLNYARRARKQIVNFRSLAIDYGQWRTIRDWNSQDGENRPIPWYTYPTTEYLSHLDLSRFSVFEYGSGSSTLWWASRAKQVVSVEDDELWYRKINKDLEKNFAMLDIAFKKIKLNTFKQLQVVPILLLLMVNIEESAWSILLIQERG